MEAEHYDDNVAVGGHQWELTGPTGGFTGVAGMHAPNGRGGHSTNYAANSERLEYEIDFVKTSTHYVWILAWGADGNASSDTSVATDGQKAVTAPYWVKLERDFAGNFRGYYSSDGSNWVPMVWMPSISMSSNVYIGLAMTSHNAALTCEAKFSGVQTTGTVTAMMVTLRRGPDRSLRIIFPPQKEFIRFFCEL